MANFIDVPCAKCGEHFGITQELYNVLKRSGKNFNCPHGHGNFYSEGPSEADLLRQERDRLKQQLAEKDDRIKAQRDRAEAAERRTSAAKGQVTRLKNRAAAGVCPCCNRTFQNLKRHMEGQHPDFTKQEDSHVH